MPKRMDSRCMALLLLKLSPGLKTAGLPTIVPTEVVPLVTGTFTVSPPRTACWLWKVRKVGSSIAGMTVNPVSAEKRADEHTSELQTIRHLVWRLVSEKNRQEAAS